MQHCVGWIEQQHYQDEEHEQQHIFLHRDSDAVVEYHSQSQANDAEGARNGYDH